MKKKKSQPGVLEERKNSSCFTSSKSGYILRSRLALWWSPYATHSLWQSSAEVIVLKIGATVLWAWPAATSMSCKQGQGPRSTSWVSSAAPPIPGQTAVPPQSGASQVRLRITVPLRQVTDIGDHADHGVQLPSTTLQRVNQWIIFFVSGRNHSATCRYSQHQ